MPPMQADEKDLMPQSILGGELEILSVLGERIMRPTILFANSRESSILGSAMLEEMRVQVFNLSEVIVSHVR